MAQLPSGSARSPSGPTVKARKGTCRVWATSVAAWHQAVPVLPIRRTNVVPKQIERGDTLTRPIQPDMWCATTGVGRWYILGHRVSHLWRSRAVWGDRGRFVGRSEDHALLMEQLRATVMQACIFLQVFSADAPQGLQVAHRLLCGPAAHRLPLMPVRLEQCRPGPPSQHRCQLPGKVMYILNAHVHAVPSGCRHLVRRVASEEDLSLTEARGDSCRGTPWGCPN